MIVGVTGSYCAGKDTFAKYLETKGFTHISLSDFLRSELRTRKKQVTRENLILVGNELREKFGHGVLAIMALDAMEPDKKYVVSSIRHPVEVEVLKKRKNFVMVFVDAPQKNRFLRMQQRGRSEKDPSTLKEFVASEKKEKSKGGPGQQLHKVARIADVKINNTGSLEQFYKKIDAFLAQWRPKLDKRPNWDEYFLGIMRQVGRRGTCDRGKAGCVIVKDKRLLSTGYVGAPAGLPHCDEEGHEMHKVQNADGTVSNHCIRTTHAEQNAITQAARHGIPIEGSTLYCKLEPCYACAKMIINAMIINAGIKRVVCEKRYHRGQRTREILKQAGIKLSAIYEETEKYHNM